MPRLFHNHNRLFPRSDSRHLRRLLDCPVPANWRQSQTHRGMLVPTEINRTPCFDVISCKIEDGKIPFNTRKREGVPDISQSATAWWISFLVAKRYRLILKWIKSNFVWMKERREHLHEHTLSCEEGKCYR